jgi:glutathione synthase/RimK-type ligase-like ATP-grasp enzyme
MLKSKFLGRMMFPLAALLNLALLTTDEYPKAFKLDDQLLIQALQAYDIEAQSVDWRATDFAWSQFDAVLVYSTWDYYENHTQFLHLLRNIQEMGIKVYNPPSIIEWNSRKTYLKDLERLGLKTIESLYISSSEWDQLEAILLEKGWDECIIKPQVSTSGHNTHRFNCANLEPIQSMLKSCDEQFIIQPFAEEIIKEGEWSFVFFDNQYLHCLLKKPNVGGFLVQRGTKHFIEPPEWMIGEAQKIAKTLNLPVLQMRIDVIRRGNELRIMEVEVIEPSLFLRYFPGSEKIIAQRLNEKLRNCPAEKLNNPHH